MSRLRVALATRFPYSEADSFTGLSQVSLQLCRALAKRPDIDLHIVSLSSQVREIEHRQAEGYQITFFRRPSSLQFYGTLCLPASLAMRRELLRLQPDIIHAQAIAETAIGGLLTKRPLVTTIHGIYAAEAVRTASLQIKLASQVLALTEAWYVRRLPHVIICSPYVNRFVQQYNPAAKRYPISNPIDTLFFEGGLSAVPPQPRSILLIGSVTYRKGHDLMLEALAQLVPEFPDVRLTVVGSDADPVFAQSMRQMVEARGLGGHVNWLGGVSQARLVEEMRAHQIVCLPSREETLPMSLSQAMIVGNIPVASNAGGIPDMLRHGENGFMFPAGDAAALTAQLAEVMKLPAAELEAMRQRNRVYAKNTYHPDKVAEQTVAVYRQILGQ